MTIHAVMLPLETFSKTVKFSEFIETLFFKGNLLYNNKEDPIARGQGTKARNTKKHIKNNKSTNKKNNNRTKKQQHKKKNQSKQ